MSRITILASLPCIESTVWTLISRTPLSLNDLLLPERQSACRIIFACSLYTVMRRMSLTPKKTVNEHRLDNVEIDNHL